MTTGTGADLNKFAHGVAAGFFGSGPGLGPVLFNPLVATRSASALIGSIESSPAALSPASSVLSFDL